MPWGKDAALVKVLGEFRPYVGLDYGHIFSQARYGFANEDVAGWTVGAKFVSGNVSLDAGYSNIFSSTVRADTSGLAFINIAVNF